MQEGSRWKGDGLSGHYWRSVSSGCMGKFTWRKLWRTQYGKTSSMLQQGKNIGFNKMEQAATLPHKVRHICDLNLKIESSLATHNIIGHHIRQTYHHWTILFEPMYAICEDGEAQEHMWSPSARQQICREHRWRSLEKNCSAQQKTSFSLYWFTR